MHVAWVQASLDGMVAGVDGLTWYDRVSFLNLPSFLPSFLPSSLSSFPVSFLVFLGTTLLSCRDLEGNEGVFNLPFAKGYNETLGTACRPGVLQASWQACDQRFAEGLTNVMRLLKTEGLKRNPRFQLSFCAPVCKCRYFLSRSLLHLPSFCATCC
jgi:hypothetical protein